MVAKPQQVAYKPVILVALGLIICVGLIWFASRFVEQRDQEQYRSMMRVVQQELQQKRSSCPKHKLRVVDTGSNSVYIVRACDEFITILCGTPRGCERVPNEYRP